MSASVLRPVMPLPVVYVKRWPVKWPDIPGARDLVVDGRTGIIVQAGSPQAIAEGIRVLAADRAKTKMMGEAGYQRIRTEYTMEEYVRRLKGVFDAIMTK